MRIRPVLTLLISLMLVMPFAYSYGAEAAEIANVKIEKQPPTVERVQFNPWLPFTPRPKLGPGEKAFTECPYNLTVAFDDIELIEQEERRGRWFVSIRPKNVRVKLFLPIKIWTPVGAPQKCLEHEDGHRIIAERVYEFADDIVKFYAEQVYQCSSLGEGASVELAVRDAYKRASSELNQNYKKTVVDYFTMVSDEYDRLTNHGLLPVAEQDAIKESFDLCSSKMKSLLEERAKKPAPSVNRERPVTKLLPPSEVNQSDR